MFEDEGFDGVEFLGVLGFWFVGEVEVAEEEGDFVPEGVDHGVEVGDLGVDFCVFGAQGVEFFDGFVVVMGEELVPFVIAVASAVGVGVGRGF